MKGNPKLDAIVKRPMRHLADKTTHYPQIWRDHDELRTEQQQLTRWPSWCYAPVSVSRTCFELPKYGGPVSRQEEEGNLVGVAALAAWRLTKGIYLFDETIFGALWDSDLQGDLPVELLQRMPEWCVYVPFPTPREMPHICLSTAVPAFRICGFFAYLDWEKNDATWLHLCLDADYADPDHPFSLNPISLKLEGELSDSCRPFRRLLNTAVRDFPMVDITGWLEKQETDLIRPLVSILLWLCSAKPEISGLDPLRGLRTKKTKQGVRHFNAEHPRVYEVAYRIGAALRLAQEVVTRGKPGGGTHASPRPHIRKAHWQGFWTGPRASAGKDQPTERKLIPKWVAPIAVCVGTDDTIIPTIHPVIVGTELEERYGPK